jgi:hypothetical protein
MRAVGLSEILNAAYVSYFATVGAYAVYCLSVGRVRAYWVPGFANAYGTSAIVYSAIALLYFDWFRWKGIVFVALTGVVQEAAWNFQYLALYPGALAYYSRFFSWDLYVAAIVVAFPVCVLLIRRWFRVDLWPLHPFVIFAVVWFVVYWILGMPTFLPLIDGGPRTATLFDETLYVVSSCAFVLGLIEARPR